MLLVNCLILSIIILYFGLHAQASGTITLLNSTNAFCEQDVAQFNCSLDAGPTYVITQAGLSVNGSACVGAASVNIMYPRIRITSTAINAASPPAEYIIFPYLLEDSATHYSCCAPDNMQTFYYTSNITLLLAAPPSAPNISISTTYDSPTSCNGTITLTWLAVASDRTVTGYEVLHNGVVEATLPPSAGTITYTAISMTSLLTFTGRYTVRANSCTGSSVSNEVVFSPLRVTTIDYTSPVLAADGNLTLSLKFAANRTYEVNYTMYAITNFTNGSSDRRDIYTAVQNSATLLTLAIPLPYLVNSSTSLLLADVQNVSVMLTVHSQCGQVLTLSSGVIPVAISTTTRITTTTTTPTTPTTPTTTTPPPPPPTTTTPYTTTTTTTTTRSTTTPTIAVTSTASTASNAPITLLIVFIIVLVLLLLLSIIVIVILIIFILHLLRKNRYLTSKMNTDDNTLDRAHVYNYIDLNNLALTSDEQHYYSDMAPVVTNNTATAITDGNTATDGNTTSNRAEYINVSTTDINTKPTYANLS